MIARKLNNSCVISSDSDLKFASDNCHSPFPPPIMGKSRSEFQSCLTSCVNVYKLHRLKPVSWIIQCMHQYMTLIQLFYSAVKVSPFQMYETHFSIPYSWSPSHLLFIAVPPRLNERSQILQVENPGTEVKPDDYPLTLSTALPSSCDSIFWCLSCPWTAPFTFILDYDLSYPSLHAYGLHWIRGACCQDARHGQGGGYVLGRILWAVETAIQIVWMEQTDWRILG